MELPHRYPYNPRWRAIGIFLAWGAGMFALAALHAPAWFFVPMGTVLVTAGLFGTVRRLALPRFVELGQDAVLLPTGSFRRRIKRIPYADIERIQESRRKSNAFLQLRTKQHVFVIASMFLPDMADFVAIRDFLNLLPGPKEKAISRQNQASEPGKYCFQCTYEGNGTIYNSKGEIVWHVKTQHFNGRPRYPYGFFRLSDFVVYDKTDKEFVRVKRERSFLAAQFVMLENGRPVCIITRQSILMNKYKLDFMGQSKWTFKMPLFTVIFRGKSDTGAQIQAHLRTHNLWYVFIDSDADNPRLVAALAFIHRERLRCN